MNVLINKEEMIDAVAREYVKIAKKLKIAMVDSYFEDKVSIENVEAAFNITKEAEKNLSEVYELEARIKVEYGDPIEDIKRLNEITDKAIEKTNALNSVLESL